MSDEELRGASLKIYLHLLLANEPRGVRDLSRDLGIPVSTVHYHIKKLREAGLIRELPEGYVVSRRVRIEGFVYLGRKLVPRLAIYSAFFLGVAAGLVGVTILWGNVNVDRLIAVTSSAISSALTALEARRVSKNLAS
ncbi:MAG: helix-turn-helix domain-containing protein [Sulfolobales archaeon]|nr:helix-turn-helix domain-containing protein [Sulfolobales archaeon]MCX8208568.1 helix-turn-helix domain-containing protein [Sulfolobales archaeon]MDW8010914.1 helix-turn-helix domain-containing protein [Sulfolobales archaeon]